METLTSPSSFQRALVLVVVAGGLFIAGQYVASQPARIQREIEANREITVQGTGEIVATPTVADITLSAQTGPQASPAAALTQLATRFNAILEAVKRFDVKKEDIATTDLAINPVYDYANGRQALRGFEARQSVRVTIRDLQKVGEVVAAASSEGVTQVGGIEFTVDNPQELATQAEEKAIADAKAKAERLARELGARLGDVKSYQASSASPGPIFRTSLLEAAGGDGAGVPPVPEGSTTTTATVTITYALR